MAISYDFPNKEQYRNRRELSINKFCKKPVALRRVVYLDSPEGLDTITYLRRGYTPENLYPITFKVGQAAHITRHAKQAGYDGIKAYSGDFFKTALRVPQVDIIDFDGTGCIDLDLATGLMELMQAHPKAVLCLTILAAREGGNWRDGLQREDWTDQTVFRTSFNTEVRKSHYMRMVTLARIISHNMIEDILKLHENTRCWIHINRLFWDVYKSTSGQPMLWAVAEYEPHRTFSKKELLQKARFFANGDSLEACYRPICINEFYADVEQYVTNLFNQPTTSIN